MEKIVIQTTEAPAPIGPYSQAVIAGGFLYISGQIALNPVSGELVLTSVEEETTLVMHNLQAILTKAGYDFNHVIKSTIFLTDMNLFAAVNTIYGQFFTADYPARETVAVKGLPKGVHVEISMIAYK